MEKNLDNFVKFLGIKINDTFFEDVQEKIRSNLEKKAYICLLDATNIIRAAKDKELSLAINSSLLSIPDGMPLVWYGKLVGCSKIERIAGFDLMKKIFKSHDGLKHYLLGDTEQTIGKVIRNARKENINLRITGHSPPFRDKFTKEDNDKIFQKINKANPDIIWVSFGGKKQEKWMHQNVNRLNRGVMAGVGAAFKFYIGDLYIPPKIAQSLGMQWFFRMLHNPVRWAKLTLRDKFEFVIYFPFEVIKHYIQMLKFLEKVG
jgi:N-acetylglucosaminyldiphosphoundecaprenol N-acetyl-beta-D-mannosaminyltransferase